jgi:hypothetical protein
MNSANASTSFNKWNRHHRRQQRNQELRVKPAFTSLNAPEVHVVNRWTDRQVLHDLCNKAQVTCYYSIDTESDLFSQRPALIQIEMIDEHRSVVALVEVCHLPWNNPTSTTLWLIRSFIQLVLRSVNTLYAWGNGKDELRPFVSTGLFTNAMVDQCNLVNIQEKYKQWYGQTHTSDPTGKQRWGLQAAVAASFDEFLDKSETLNQWSRGLDRSPRTLKRQGMIDYAVNDCLAVTKLASLMGLRLVSRDRCVEDRPHLSLLV